MSTPLPDWSRLLRHQQRIGRQGLTIPFLVGALRELRPSAMAVNGNRDVLALLELMRDEMPDDQLVRISLCGTLNQPVTTWLRENHYMRAAADVKFRRAGALRDVVIVEPRYGNAETSSMADVASALLATCAAAISESRFSYSREAFRQFDANDRKFIAAALAFAEDDDL